MARAFDLVVFDWDGTIADSTGVIVDSILAASCEMGLVIPSRSSARQIIGLSLDSAVRYLFPQINEEQVLSLMQGYKDNYLQRASHVDLFDGIYEVMSLLRSKCVKLAVATGKSRRGLNRVLDELQLAHMFEATRTADECFSKPHPQMLEEIMDDCGVAPSRTLMIGDTTHDLQMALNAGVGGVAVSYGAHTVEQLSLVECVCRADSVSELSAWLSART